MQSVRTPDERFANLVDWPYEPVYTTISAGDGSSDTLRVAHYETGPANAANTILVMHGEPSWSYLYRKMMTSFVAGGHRVIAPDLIGFGRSDKPTQTSDYTYERHVAWMNEWLRTNNFTNLTLVCQDWGGLIGLRVATENVDRFTRIAIANTGLPLAGRQPSAAFRAWQKYSQEVPNFDVGKLVSGGCAIQLSPEVIAAYDAPFPDDTYKAGARIFPALYPDGDDHPSNIANKKAWDVLRSWEKPFITAFSDGDPVTGGGHTVFQRDIPGAAGQPHTTIVGGGHFLQEDKGDEFAAVVNQFIASNPVT
jgi:haloalkane dehalogenase